MLQLLTDITRKKQERIKNNGDISMPLQACMPMRRVLDVRLGGDASGMNGGLAMPSRWCNGIPELRGIKKSGEPLRKIGLIFGMIGPAGTGAIVSVLGEKRKRSRSYAKTARSPSGLAG